MKIFVVLLLIAATAVENAMAAAAASGFFDLTKEEYPTCYANGSSGVCVFSLMCTYGGGRHLGICRDRFYFASCCDIDDVGNGGDDVEDDKDDPPTPTPTPDFEAIEAEQADDNYNSVVGDDEVCGTREAVSSTGPYVDGVGLFRIVGGNSSSFGVWPWQVSLMVVYPGSETQRCGAVLVGRNWVATAAHCVRGFDPPDFRLRFGDHDRMADDEPLPHVDRDAYEIFVHPDYDSVSYEFDIALIYFDRPVKYRRHIRPICLPKPWDKSALIEGKAGKGYVTGWGTVYEGGPKPEILNEAEVPVFDHRVCAKIFKLAGLDEKLSDAFICAGIEEGGTDACEGDSGGPLVMENRDTGRWTLAGIVSWGNGCGERYQPGVYTNVAKLSEWIFETMDEETRMRKALLLQQLV